MRVIKVAHIVSLVLLSCQVRISQERSLKDDEAISDKLGDTEESYAQECACFPKSNSGILISEYFSPDEEKERVVVYFYKRRKSKKITVFIPSMNKQRILPELTIDKDDKLETMSPDEVINLFHEDRLYFTKLTKEIDLNLVKPIVPNGENVVAVNLPNTAFIDTLNIGANNQQGNTLLTAKEINQLIPVETSATLALSNVIDSKITDNKLNHNLHLSLGNEQMQIKNIIEEPSQIQLNKHNEIQTRPIQETLTHLLPIKSQILTTDELSQITHSQLNNTKSQNLNLHLGQTMKITPAIPGKLNLALYPPPGFKESSLKYTFPEYLSLLPGSNLVSTKYLPSEYKHPTFDNWFTKQMNSIRSERPSMYNTIDFSLLWLLLTKALYHNGIHLSSKGELYDSNEKILEMKNLKLRPILIGDPVDYKKLVATNKCVIPYNIPYFEAVLVSLIYPPRILAIIPLRKVIATNDKILYEKIHTSLCENSNCDAHEDVRSGQEEEGPKSELITKSNSEYLDENLQTRAVNVRSGDTVEENRQILSKDETIKYGAESRFDNQNSLLQTNNGESVYGDKMIYFDDQNYLEERKPSEHIEVPQKVANEPEEDYDMLTFRIVGGNPATSSGTPVSNKGRSGFDV